jgi:hypothetical protein
MKKQVKIIIGVVLVIAILVVGISLFFPAVFKDMSSGTFGKADKYHKSQMTEADVKLRSEFVADTAKLQGMIQGLIYFALFTQDLSHSIDSCVSTFQQHGICSQEGGCNTVIVLQDYSDYIKNNNKTLGTTISMLTGFYLKDKSDQSADVEKNLRDFGNYVNNLNEKDSILELALRSMDNFMLNKKVLQTRKTEIASLKSIRDQLLIKSVQMASLMSDAPLGVSLCSYAIGAEPGLGQIIQNQGVNAIHNEGSLNIIKNSGDLGFDFTANVIAIGSAQEIGVYILQSQQSTLGIEEVVAAHIEVGSAIVYNQQEILFSICNMADLSRVIQSSGSLAVALCSNNELSVCGSSFPLSNLYEAKDNIGIQYGAIELFYVCANVSIGSVYYGSEFVASTSGIGNQAIGMFIDN